MTCVLPVTVIRHDDNDDDIYNSAEDQSSSGPLPGRQRVSLENGGVSPPPRMLHSRRVRSAVIVAAGLSTRMFPASAVVKKELFPIVDCDGVCKPVILAVLEGLAESGIERFVVVVQEGDIKVFDEFFSMNAVKKHKHRCGPASRRKRITITRIS